MERREAASRSPYLADPVRDEDQKKEGEERGKDEPLNDAMRLLEFREIKAHLLVVDHAVGS